MASGPGVDWRVGLVDPTTGVPLSGFPSTVADGANVVEGATTDAAVGDASGTLNAHLRQVAKNLATVADADALANPTVAQMEVFPHCWNGTTWDRWKDINAGNNLGTFTGIPAVGLTMLDTVNSQMRRLLTVSSGLGGLDGTHTPSVGPLVYDGSVWRVLKGNTDGSLPVGGFTATISTTLTRPANTTAYTANDEMTDTGAAIQTLTSIARASGGTGEIRQLVLTCSSNAATKPDLTVFFYDTTSTPAADNAAFAPSDGVQDTCIGYVRLTGSEVGDATGNTGNFVMDSGPISIPFTCVGSANLFVRVKVNNAYTAGAVSDTYKLRVKVAQD